MVVAVAIQVGTNYANDYSRRRTGHRRRPGRADSGWWGRDWRRPGAVKRAAVVAFGVAAVAGLTLAAAVSLGAGHRRRRVASSPAGYYTGRTRPYGYLGLGEVFVFVFFGLVATVGSTYVQTESVTGLAVMVAVPVGLLATALLVINNLRDIPGDTLAGKRTLAVRLGAGRTRLLYAVLVGGAGLVIAAVAVVGHRPVALGALAAMVLAWRPVRAVVGGESGMALVPVLADTGRVQLVTGVALAAGLVVSA